jgi:peroxiredoxin
LNRNARNLVLTSWTIVALIGLCGCGGGEESAADSQSADPVVGSGTGNLAPPFTVQTIDGGTLELASLQGKAVIVDFWDTWCPPCKKAMPHLQELSVAYDDELVVVGVAMGRDGLAKIRSFVQDNGLTFTMALANEAIVRDFGGLTSIPTTFLIDADGVIRQKWVGYNDKAVYERAVRQVIGIS